MATRILYIHGIGDIGGAERDLLAMLTVLNRAEWEPHVACPVPGPLSRLVKMEGISFHPLELSPWRKWYSPVVRWRGVKQLRTMLQQLRPALIHVNDFWWVPHTIEAVTHSHPPRPLIVGHVRQEIEPEKARRYGLNDAAAVITMSKQIEQSVIAGGASPQRVKTIYSGLDLSVSDGVLDDGKSVRQELGVPEGAILLGTVANLFPRKGYDIMLKAFPAIIQAEPSAHYVIIGTGEAEYTRSLHELAGQLGVESRVHFAGFRESVNPFLSALDLYVHPARMEGFGIAAVEAMAAGKAVVATKTGGLPEVVEDGRTGLLVAPNNPDEFSAAVISLLRDKVRREEMGKRGVARVHQLFELKSSVAAMERLYRHVLAGMENGRRNDGDESF